MFCMGAAGHTRSSISSSTKWVGDIWTLEQEGFVTYDLAGQKKQVQLLDKSGKEFRWLLLRNP